MSAMSIRRMMVGTAAAALAGAAVPAPVAAQTTDTAMMAQQTTPVEREDDGPDLGWLGLLGLAGLAGLRRREPTVVHRDTVHTEPRR